MAATEATQTEVTQAKTTSSPIIFNSSTRTPTKSLTRYTFRIQSAPPLSLQQYMRTSVGVLPGAKKWQPSGKYHPPVFHSYMSPAKKTAEKKVEPVWRIPGPYKDKRPTPLSPETIKIEQKKLPAWNPPGKFQHKPVPYFDPPSLRWSYQELLRSMPELRPERLHSARRSSSVRRSEAVKETTQTS